MATEGDAAKITKSYVPAAGMPPFQWAKLPENDLDLLNKNLEHGKYGIKVEPFRKFYPSGLEGFASSMEGFYDTNLGYAQAHGVAKIITGGKKFVAVDISRNPGDPNGLHQRLLDSEALDDGLTYIAFSSEEFEQLLKLEKEDVRKRYAAGIKSDDSARSAFQTILRDAIASRASDVHVEPFCDGARVRFRIDGVLHQQEYNLTKDLLDGLARVVKINSRRGMKMDVSDFPQKGSIILQEDAYDITPVLRKYNIRAATMPHEDHESITIRVLESAQSFDISKLGFPEKIEQRIREQFAKPYGLFLVTGPTGSGKTTTLYSILSQINTVERKIITAEDPVEIRMNGINQVSVTPNLSYADILKNSLRHDPDVIFVGEIRDKETASLAFGASNTGHLVLSTLHTNNSLLSLTRLFELGLEPSIISASLIGVLSQRLVRKGSLEEGYFERTVVPELWVVGDSERELISQGYFVPNKFLDLAIKGGMIPLAQAGVNLVEQRITDLAELKRVLPHNEVDYYAKQILTEENSNPEAAARFKE